MLIARYNKYKRVMICGEKSEVTLRARPSDCVQMLAVMRINVGTLYMVPSGTLFIVTLPTAHCQHILNLEHYEVGSVGCNWHAEFVQRDGCHQVTDRSSPEPLLEKAIL